MNIQLSIGVLDNQRGHQYLRDNARVRMIPEFSFEVCLPKPADFYLKDTHSSEQAISPLAGLKLSGF
jgi:hypothetical protein